MLVLLAAAAVFALALQGAVLSRAATVEAGVMRARAEHERGARSAASMVLTGLSTTIERYRAQVGSSAPPVPGGDGGGGADEEEKPRIELPAILKEMLGEQAEDIEEEAKETIGGAGAADGGGITGRLTRSLTKPTVLVSSLPVEPVRVTLREGGPEYMVTLTDAASVININLAGRDQLVKYFAAKGLEAGRAGSAASQIIDWRDADDFAEPGGAEESAYRARGVRCRNAPFQALEELKYLSAFTAEVYERVRVDLSVGGTGEVHLGTASREVLLSLPGMDEETASRLMAARRGGPIEEQDVERLVPLHARAAAGLLKVRPSNVVRVRVEVVGDSRAVFEGLAVMGEKGIRALGLRALL